MSDVGPQEVALTQVEGNCHEDQEILSDPVVLIISGIAMLYGISPRWFVRAFLDVA
ncbi:MAG TPA: hypothetical protein VIM43_04165 [Rugosibacter sp.]